jgi:DtxR family Mn-dependent transcriptional regulator
MTTPVTEKIEEALNIIWTHTERLDNDFEKVKNIITESLGKEVFDTITTNNLTYTENGKIFLNSEGENAAKNIVRKHRLLEKLMADVVKLSVKDSEVAACDLEHKITDEEAESIAKLLNNPKACPHGSEIPPSVGESCKEDTLKKVSHGSFLTLNKLNAGDRASVAFIETSTSSLHKLMSLGLVPGSNIVLTQKTPSYMLKVNETVIAVEPKVAEKIYITRY